MNDNHRTPGSDDPDELGAGDPAVAERLRRTLQAVAAATPTEDRSAALLAAIDAPRATAPSVAEPLPEEEPAMTLDTASARRRPVWRRPAFLAAAAALVVAVVGLAVLAADDDEALRIDPAGPAEGPLTGWFLPPEGWEIDSIVTEFLDVGEVGACPCSYWTAAEVGADPAAVSVQETGVSDSLTLDFEEPAVDIDVDGREGRYGAMTDNIDVLVVPSGERQVIVFATDVDRVAMVALADAWLDHRDAAEAIAVGELPLPAGFARTAVVTTPAVASVHLVEVTATEVATGRQVHYQAVPSDWFRTSVLGATSVAFDSGVVQAVVDENGRAGVVLLGGPADVAVGQSFFGGGDVELSVDELVAFAEGLRQVSTDDWREALAAAGGEVDVDVVEAPTLFEPPLVDAPVDG